MSSIQRLLKIDLPVGQSGFLWGARKTGKSTFLKSHFPHATYVDLLQADVYQSYLRDPTRLRQEILAAPSSLVILDEVQKIPLLLDEVHWLIENQKPLQFILCGSSARRLKSTGANLLGGRAWRYNFLPLCYGEIKELNWKRIFNNGLIPSHYLSENPSRYHAAYLFDYLLTEVQFEANLRKRDHFARFLEALGFCHGELVNYSNIARDCSIDSKTVRTYFEILEDMYLGYCLTPFHSRSGRQTIQETPKFYLFDTGLANYLRKYEFKDMRGAEAGKSFEHYIFLELMAYKLLTQKRESIHFWRTKEGHEVDFIVQDKAIEVKISSTLEKRDLKGLFLFSQEVDTSLHVISLETRKRLMNIEGKEIIIWPVQEFLDQLWAGEFWK